MLKLIQSLQTNMTEAEYIVSEKVLENPEIVMESTITTLANRYHVSRNAITRFCQKIGFAGYSDFKYELTKWLHTIDNQNEEVNNISKIIQTTVYQINDLTNYIDEQQLISFVEEIKKANRIVVLGSGKSRTATEEFQRRFHQLGKEITLVDCMYMPGDFSYFFNPNDIVIVFSVTLGSAVTNNLIENALKVTKNIYFITMAKQISFPNQGVFQLPSFSRKNSAYMLEQQILFLVMTDLIVNYYLLK